MSAVDFSSLDLIPKLLEKIENMEAELKEIKEEVKPELNLTKRADVRKYLNVSERTLCTMTEDGRLREGVHFVRDSKLKNRRITFISSAIVDYKEKKK